MDITSSLEIQMATLENVRFVPHHVTRDVRSISYTASSSRPILEGVPLIFWADCRPWREANLWAVERATDNRISLKTVVSNMNGLLHYANFLELRQVHWFQFPQRKADRCLVLYRGALIKLRDLGEISPATASEYMRNCIMFYRWVQARQLLDIKTCLWVDQTFFVRYFDEVGFERTISGITTDLKIPNRKRPGMLLEDGLLPVSPSDREVILDFAATNGSREIFLMLALGFFTGMRIGTICDLKVQTLINAAPDPSAPGLLKIAIGPGASPPVATKFSVTGQVWIPDALRDELLDYAGDLRRIKRQAIAPTENQDLLFLTRFGNSYGRRGSDQSSSVNVEMSVLRQKALQAECKALRNFRFHQTRCTFGTELARLCLSTCSDVAVVIAMVGNALLHGGNSEAVTFKYIRFVQTLPIKRELSHRFMREFNGFEARARTNDLRE